MRRIVVGAVALATIAGVTACAPSAETQWTPPSWPTTDVRTIETVPGPLDAGALAGLVPQRLRQDAVGIQARFVTLPGAAGSFDREVVARVRAAIDARAVASGTAYRPEAFPVGAGLGERGCAPGDTLRPGPEILADPRTGPAGASGTAVVCDIVVAGGTILAERLRVVSGSDGTVTSDASIVLYTDTPSGEVTDGAGLWSAGAIDELHGDIVEALRRTAGSLSLAPARPGDAEQAAILRAALATTVPTGGGALAFTIPAGFSSVELAQLGMPETTEPMTVEVPAALVEGLATDLGRRVAGAIDEPYAGPTGWAGSDDVDCTLLPCVAVTYDDGPSRLTPQLLDILAERRAPATFYMLGQSASARPDDVRRAAAEGHQIGDHTWSHPSLPTLTPEQVSGQISRSRDLLQNLSGQPVGTFRPPYGEYDQRVLDAAGIPAILWSVDTRDWAGPADDALLAGAVGEPGPGGIVLFHDTHERSIRVAGDVIDGLRDRGFTLATIDQLFGGPPGPGAHRRAD